MITASGSVDHFKLLRAPTQHTRARSACLFVQLFVQLHVVGVFALHATVQLGHAVVELLGTRVVRRLVAGLRHRGDVAHQIRALADYVLQAAEVCRTTRHVVGKLEKQAHDC